MTDLKLGDGKAKDAAKDPAKDDDKSDTKAKVA